MEILREQKDELNSQEILDWISKYESEVLPRLNKCRDYSKGANPTILKKTAKDANSPDNKVPVSYGRKLTTTFSGYGYRPGYIMYLVDEDGYKSYLDMVTEDFAKNNESLKTSRNGKHTGIYGVGYELVYLLDKEIRFVPIKPQEVILLYDMEAEPQPKIAIRFVKITDLKYTVDVYYKNRVYEYERSRSYVGAYDWKLIFVNEYENFFNEIPVIAYYLDDDIEGLIWPVRDLIDMLDALISGNMDEFERFAQSYLRLVGMNFDDPRKQSANKIIDTLKNIRKRRAFTNLKDKDDVTFLTKDLPTEFLKMMYDILKEQIHKQSHVPDMDQRELSGVAVDRMMFDFENVVSTAEGYFNIGIYKRIELMNKIYVIRGKQVYEPSVIKISHKRNAPVNEKEFAETALIMKQAGFSREAIVNIMPDDIIPDAETEIARQKEEAAAMMPDITDIVIEEPDADI